MELRTIKNFDNYQISDNGDLYSVRNKRFLKLGKSKKGYMRGRIINNTVKSMVSIHRIVAEAFIENKENKPFINHIDGNKTNNHISNLEWCTASENSIHAIKLGISNDRNGDKNGNSKLTAIDVRLIRELHQKTKLKQVFIAGVFNVERKTISRIMKNQRWPILIRN